MLTKIGLEAPIAEVEQLNSYISGGQGNLKQILASFRLFNYECQEFNDLVESVKILNKSTDRPICFFGMDMQSPFQSLQNILNSCASNDNIIADSVRKLTEYYRTLNNEMYNHSFNEGDFTELVTMSNLIFKKLEAQKADCLNTELIRRSIINYRQFLLLNNPKFPYEAKANLRDSLMAENVLREINSGDKIVLLAHNGHVQRTPNTYSKSMGYFLSQKLGLQYQCIALTTTSGFYTAFTPEAGRITDKNAIPVAYRETFEYCFSKIGPPMFFFKTAPVKQKVGNKTVPAKYKLLPFGLTDKPFVTGNLLDDFDYVLHIEITTGNRSFYLK
jgi:erythromycin esterase-like protein